MSNPTTSSVDYSLISKHVTVHGDIQGTRSRRHAAYYINQGYRVTDHHGFDLTVETRSDGTRRVVRGEDPLGSFNERNRQRTLARAALTDESGRPLGLPGRELTDYEAGRPHPKDCGIPNCDNPIHFPGGEDGKVKFEKLGDPKEGKDGDGSAGGSGGAA